MRLWLASIAMTLLAGTAASQAGWTQLGVFPTTDYAGLTYHNSSQTAHTTGDIVATNNTGQVSYRTVNFFIYRPLSIEQNPSVIYGPSPFWNPVFDSLYTPMEEEFEFSVSHALAPYSSYKGTAYFYDHEGSQAFASVGYPGTVTVVRRFGQWSWLDSVFPAFLEKQ